MEKKKIIVVGIDAFNEFELSQIKDFDRYEFITLFDPKEIQNQEEIDVEKIIQTLNKTIRSQKDGIDGIITFFDFPFTLVTFYIAKLHNLKGPSLLSGLKCEHKYWSRIEQSKIVPANVPRFDEIDPFDEKRLDELSVKPPFWIKPVKTHSSQLGFKVETNNDFEQAITKIKKRIHHFAKPFNFIFYKEDLPAEIRKIDGFHCLTEELLKGHQCTLSGYVYNHEVYTYGIVDSLFYDQAPSFLCYMLPSRLPGSVKERMQIIAKDVMKHIDFNHAPFNIEFFYNEENNDIKILEINPRMSQSHGYIYSMLKGHSNHQVLVKLAIGEKPDFIQNKGKYPVAAKFQYRIFHDGKVEQLPSEYKIKKLENEFPDSNIQINVKEGDILSTLKINDAYSYCIAEVMLAAESKEALFDKYEKIKNSLNIKIEKR
jgi:hypothetical protein